MLQQFHDLREFTQVFRYDIARAMPAVVKEIACFLEYQFRYGLTYGFPRHCITVDLKRGIQINFRCRQVDALVVRDQFGEVLSRHLIDYIERHAILFYQRFVLLGIVQTFDRSELFQFGCEQDYDLR